MDEQGYLLDKWHPHYPTGYLLRVGSDRWASTVRPRLRLDETLSNVKIREVKE